MKKILIYSLGLSAMLVSCNSKSTSTNNQPEKDTIASTQHMVGNDVDEHGCKASAGYTWSEALQECIRLWEKGVKMDLLENPGSTSAAFIVFSNDSSQVELFLPDKEVHTLLQRMHPVSAPDKEVWSSDKASNGLKVYRDASKLWVIEQDGKVQCREVSEK